MDQCANSSGYPKTNVTNEIVLMLSCLTTILQPISEGPPSDGESDCGKGRLFHRSVSMGTNGAPWSKREPDGRLVGVRKRNNSTCDVANGEIYWDCKFSITFPKLYSVKDEFILRNWKWSLKLIMGRLSIVSHLLNIFLFYSILSLS